MRGRVAQGRCESRRRRVAPVQRTVCKSLAPLRQCTEQKGCDCAKEDNECGFAETMDVADNNAGLESGAATAMHGQHDVSRVLVRTLCTGKGMWLVCPRGRVEFPMKTGPELSGPAPQRVAHPRLPWGGAPLLWHVNGKSVCAGTRTTCGH